MQVSPAVQVPFVRIFTAVMVVSASLSWSAAANHPETAATAHLPSPEAIAPRCDHPATLPPRRLRLGMPSDRAPLAWGTHWRPQGLVAGYVRQLPADAVALQVLPTVQLRQRLRQGELDAVIGLPRSELPSGWVASTPFITLPLLIATRRNGPPVLSVEDLHGGLVAVLDPLPPALAHSLTHVLPPSNGALALNQLRQGQVDAVVGNAVLLQAQMRLHPDDSLVISASTTVMDPIFFAAAPGCAGWTVAFDAAVARMPAITRDALRQQLASPVGRLSFGAAGPSGWMIGAAALLFLACVQGLGTVRLRREGQRRLQLQRRLQEISDNLPAVVFQAGMPCLRRLELDFVAGDAPQLFSLSGELLRAQPARLLDAIPPRHRMRVLMALARTVSRRQPLQLEFPAEGVHGLRWLAMRAWPVGGRHLWSGYWLDSTGQQLDQLALARAHAQAQADLGAREQLLAALGEGVREPMQVLQGALDGLHGAVLAVPEQNALAVLGDAASMLDALLQEVLGQVDSQELEPPGLRSQPIDLRALLESVRQLLAPVAAAKGLWFRSTIDPALAPCVMVDGVRLRQVLFNLLGNSLKFTARGGVALAVGVVAGEAAGATQRVCISVQDTGLGIEPERQQAVFEPYAQADATTARRYGGTGLGLGISRRLVQHMGGELSLHSQPGQGSRVDIQMTLHCCRDDQPLPTPAMQPGQGAAWVGEPLRVLVAEDHPTQQLLLDNWLRELGVAPDAAADGMQALQAWRQRRHALLLTDLQMPGMGGRELATAIRQEEQRNGWARMPIIGLSADEAGLQGAGIDQVIRKPISRQTLFEAIEQLLGPLPGQRPRAAAIAAPPVDLPSLEALAQRFGSVANARVLVASLASTLDEDLHALQQARSALDEEAIRQRLHRIAGGVGSIGMPNLTEALRSVSEAPAPLSLAALDRLEWLLQQCRSGLLQLLEQPD